MSNFKLSNGLEIPEIGFGTWQIKNGDDAYNACKMALELGYRHIDTAYVYGNEESVGKAIKDSGLKREEIFLTSKLPSHIKTYEGAKEYLAKTLKNLDTDYLDLYLIHAPWPWDSIGKDCEAGNREVWKLFEEEYKKGTLKSIGISNFSVANIKNIESIATVQPMVNQIKYHIGYTEPEIVKYCNEKNILVEAYSPMGTGKILGNKDIEVVANKYGKSITQICIKYCLQNNTLPLPKSGSYGHIKENFDLDFTISDEDMKYLDNITL